MAIRFRSSNRVSCHKLPQTCFLPHAFSVLLYFTDQWASAAAVSKSDRRHKRCRRSRVFRIVEAGKSVISWCLFPIFERHIYLFGTRPQLKLSGKPNRPCDTISVISATPIWTSRSHPTWDWFATEWKTFRICRDLTQFACVIESIPADSITPLMDLKWNKCI